MGNAVQIKALFFSLIRGSPGAEIVFLNQDLAICPRSVFRDFYAHLLGPFTRRLLDLVHETRDCLRLIEFHDEMLDGIEARAHPTRGSRAGLSVKQMLNRVGRIFGGVRNRRAPGDIDLVGSATAPSRIGFERSLAKARNIRHLPLRPA
jgi:hypothetical protein